MSGASWGAGPFTAGAAGGSTQEIDLTGLTAGRSVVCLYRVTQSEAGNLVNSVACAGETVDLSTLFQANGVGMNYYVATIKKLATGGNKTMVFTTNGNVISGCGIWAREVIGLDVDGASIVDDINGAAGNSDNANVTLALDNGFGMIVAQCTSDSGGEPIPSTAGYTDVDLTNVSWWDRLCWDLDVGAAGSKNVAFNPNGAGGNWAVHAIALIAAPFDALPGTAPANALPAGVVIDDGGYQGKFDELDIREWFG